MPLTSSDQLVAHAVGDYLLQSSWQANNKTTNTTAAATHALLYSLPFLLFRPSARAYVGIVATHFLIDRFRLARHVVWAKNWLAPKGQDHTHTATGMPESTPVWLSTWLLILTDNLIHVILNGVFLNGRNVPDSHDVSTQG